ncbi:MAG: NlpC/P60 family protein [Atopobiaceae bacterium]
MHIKKIATVGLAGALALSMAPIYAFATPSLDEARQTMASLGDELKNSQTALSQAAGDYEKTQSDIDATQAEIDQTQQNLFEAKSQLSSTMRDGYKNNTSQTLMHLVMASSSLENLVDNLYYADKVSDAYAQQIKTVNDLQTELSNKLSDLQVEQARQQEYVDSAQKEVDAYQSRLDEATAYYQSLSEEVRAQLAQEAAQNAEVDSQGVVSNSLSNAVSSAESHSQSSTNTDNSGSQNTSDSQDSSSNNQTSNNESGNNSGNSSSSDSGSSNSGSSNSGSSNSSSNSGSSSNSSSNNSSSGAVEGGGLSSVYAMIGVPYVWGGYSASGVDCSGLVYYCYGSRRGRTTYDMIASLQSTGDWKTSMSDLSVGDLVFPSSGHVGIYIGNGQMIHAPYPGRTVCIASVYSFIGGGTY